MRDSRRSALDAHLKGVSSSTLDVLAKRLFRLPADQARGAVDLAVHIAGISVRPALELLRAAPDVAPFFTADELRVWGDVGAQLTKGNPEVAVDFFVSSAEVLERVPQPKRLLLLQFVGKQASLSNRTALESFRFAPEMIERVDDERLAAEILAVCLELARHSVKHSGELLAEAPDVVAHLRSLDPSSLLAHRAAAVASAMAHRSGGTATDFFKKIPTALRSNDIPSIVRLFDETEQYLDRSGSVALQYFVAGGTILHVADAATYERWSDLTRAIALHSNAATYHYLKFSPTVIAELRRRESASGTALVLDVLSIVASLGERSPQAAVECFRAAPRALATASMQQFRSWAVDGLRLIDGNPRQLQAYFALESRGSHDALRAREGGLTLDEVGHTLKLYVEGLTGRQLQIASVADVPEESTIGDGSIVYLPSVVEAFATDDENFRLFKVLAAHGAGQIEFGTYDRSTDDLQAAAAAVRERLTATGRKAVRLRDTYGYADVLKYFPDGALARRIFTTLENGRIDTWLRATYRGLRRDLDFIRERFFTSRPPVDGMGPEAALHELLLQAAIGGGIRPDAKNLYARLAGELEQVVVDSVLKPDATVGDTLNATARIYGMVLRLEADSGGQRTEGSAPGSDAGDELDSERSSDADAPTRQSRQAASDQSERVSHWSQTSPEAADSDIESAWNSPAIDAPEQDLESGDLAFSYDEWDRELGDSRVGWCRIIERQGTRGSRSFVELARSRYSGVISSIRHQFQLMRPEHLQRIRGEVDGEEYDLQQVIDFAIDRRATGRVDERLYTRKLRRQRDVAVSFLLDMSSSTARSISRVPNQPYSHPGRRIIDIEKEGLVLMSEALEAVGDAYAMHGFTSEGRRNVKFHVFKDFGEAYSSDVERRIGGISYHNNTRLGTAIRHSVAKLKAQQARTRLLVVLSDGRPYDHDYGDSRYAREDTKMALREAKRSGITPFCITIDRESEDQLKDMYGEVGYTIIDDVMSLPERMPAIYRRLTT
ncbi:MAG: VWA domain-containing protein [Blastocatellia bacterium]|nr:VWA domain-containing protein [Blastocatellia bacterium]